MSARAPEGSAALSLVIRETRVSGRPDPADIGIAGGRIAAVAPARSLAAPAVLDAGGRVVLPGLIEPHIHPDKAFLLERLPSGIATLQEAIAATARLKAEYTVDDVRERSRRVLNLAVANGTTAMRCHPDVDPIERLLGVEVLLELKEAHRALLDLQIVAFPQEGIFQAPGTENLLRQALVMGADVMGGCPYNERSEADARRHVDLAFALAAEFGVDVDLHADFADDAGDARFALAEYIARRAIDAGYEGRVCLGHVTSLGARDPTDIARVARALADAGITVMCLPATDLHLGGRRDATRVRRALTPVRALLDAGVNVLYASNNIRNAFTPHGNANMLDIGLLLARTAHMGSPADQQTILEMATTRAARALGLRDYGLEVGCWADLVILDTRSPETILMDQPARWAVLKRGRVVVTARTVMEWRVDRRPGA